MKKLSGQAIIEAVLAFSIVMVVLVALLQLSNKSVTTSGAASRQALATSYVTEGLQWLKQFRADKGFGKDGGLLSKCMPGSVCTYHLNDLDWTNSATPNIPGTEYNRNLVMDSQTANQVVATVSVSWQETGRTATAKQVFIFVNR